MANYIVTDTQLTATADAIRGKTGSNTAITWNNSSGFASNINSISLGTDTSDADATASDILSGKTAYVNGSKITGNIATKTSSNLGLSGRTVYVPKGYFSTTASKSIDTGSASTPATSITANPSISISSTGVISATVSASKSVTPTISAGYISSGTAGAISVAGTATYSMTTKAATTYNTSTSDQTIASGTYLTGKQTIRAVTTSNITATYIKNGITVKVGDAGSAGRIKNITGTMKSYDEGQNSVNVTQGSYTAGSGYLNSGSVTFTPSAGTGSSLTRWFWYAQSGSPTGSGTVSTNIYIYMTTTSSFVTTGTKLVTAQFKLVKNSGGGASLYGNDTLLLTVT